jgi:hypothetical protein
MVGGEEKLKIMVGGGGEQRHPMNDNPFLLQALSLRKPQQSIFLFVSSVLNDSWYVEETAALFIGGVGKKGRRQLASRRRKR